MMNPRTAPAIIVDLSPSDLSPMKAATNRNIGTENISKTASRIMSASIRADASTNLGNIELGIL